jgi:hypothetical protein
MTSSFFLHTHIFLSRFHLISLFLQSPHFPTMLALLLKILFATHIIIQCVACLWSIGRILNVVKLTGLEDHPLDDSLQTRLLWSWFLFGYQTIYEAYCCPIQWMSWLSLGTVVYFMGVVYYQDKTRWNYARALVTGTGLMCFYWSY